MTRARRSAWAVGALAVVLAVVVGVIALARAGDDASGGGSAGGGTGVVRDVGGAREPFAGLTSGTITVGGRDLEAVVADSESDRVAGLRGRSGPEPYAAMLFVFDADTTTAFTMAGVPAALDIAFFAADGRRVDALRMEPCAGTDATCPVYRASGPFRYAVETAPGAMPLGDLRVRD